MQQQLSLFQRPIIRGAALHELKSLKVKMVRLKIGRIRLAKCTMAMTNPPKYYNTQNRDDHCAYHTNTLSYYKQILYFVIYASKLSKVVLKVRDSQSSWRGLYHFRDPPP